MVSIYVENLTKLFDTTVRAVDNLTLKIQDKTLVGFLGPSGCGKTTTLRIIAGLETPTSGKVYFDDQEVTTLPPQDRNIAMVFQFPVIYPGMNVYRNISFPLEVRKIPSDEIRRRVKEIADIMNLTEYLYKSPDALDIGARQKIVLARAFCRDANAYLLDEPLTSIDPKSRIELRGLIRFLAQKFKRTLIYVTHDQAEVLTIADQIAVMNKGRLLQYDTPINIYNNPAYTFVGWFIGDPGMNFFDCDLVKTDDKVYLDCGEFKYDITDLADELKKVTNTTQFILGIRPENIVVSTEKRTDDYFKVACDFIEYIANREVLNVSIGNISFKVKTSTTLGIRPGDQLWVTFPKNYVKIFDRKTTKLIL